MSRESAPLAARPPLRVVSASAEDLLLTITVAAQLPAPLSASVPLLLALWRERLRQVYELGYTVHDDLLNLRAGLLHELLLERLDKVELASDTTAHQAELIKLAALALAGAEAIELHHAMEVADAAAQDDARRARRLFGEAAPDA